LVTCGMAEPPRRPAGWEPAIGDRVVLMRTGQSATVLRLAPTEWGLLCDLELDPPTGAGRGAHERRVHASTELAPLDP
jgi:hypothetical protein